MKDRSSNVNIAVILFYSDFLPSFYFLQNTKSEKSGAHRHQGVNVVVLSSRAPALLFFFGR